MLWSVIDLCHQGALLQQTTAGRRHNDTKHAWRMMKLQYCSLNVVRPPGVSFNEVQTGGSMKRRTARRSCTISKLPGTTRPSGSQLANAANRKSWSGPNLLSFRWSATSFLSQLRMNQSPQKPTAAMFTDTGVHAQTKWVAWYDVTVCASQCFCDALLLLGWVYAHFRFLHRLLFWRSYNRLSQISMPTMASVSIRLCRSYRK